MSIRKKVNPLYPSRMIGVGVQDNKWKIKWQRKYNRKVNTLMAFCMELADSNSTKPKHDPCCWSKDKSTQHVNIINNNKSKCNHNKLNLEQTLLLLTWIPSGLIDPYFLKTTSSCSTVASIGRFGTNMAWALTETSTIEDIRRNKLGMERKVCITSQIWTPFQVWTDKKE